MGGSLSGARRGSVGPTPIYSSILLQTKQTVELLLEPRRERALLGLVRALRRQNLAVEGLGSLLAETGLCGLL
jgi:hypothetical protein